MIGVFGASITKFTAAFDSHTFMLQVLTTYLCKVAPEGVGDRKVGRYLMDGANVTIKASGWLRKGLALKTITRSELKLRRI